MSGTVDTSPTWQALAVQAGLPRGPSVPLTLTAGDITADLSRQPLDEKTWQLLLALATQESVTDWRDKLFSSAIVNSTENRAAEHWALRASPLRPDLAAVDTRLAALVDDVRNSNWRGATGKRIKNIVNIGIGGSDLGPRLVVDALRHLVTPALDFYFIANIDPAELASVLTTLDADETLFIIASKSFGTLETKYNADACRAWLLATGVANNNDDMARHFMAVTSNVAAAAVFGIPAQHCFDFPDSVGGRYSLWGPIGLVARLAIGNESFAQLLAGARALDEHFITAPLAANLPVCLALVSIWHINFMNAQAAAVLPYAHALAKLPDYLQQLVMESNGKSVTRDGMPLAHATAPVVFGAAGTIGQHSFYQLLHQGPRVIPSDIVIINEPTSNELPETATHHAWLVANGRAQADALWQGRLDASLPPHRQFAGQRPVNLLTLPRLTPNTLGQLLALYEHKTFVESVLWRINAFDQWGVELGKQLAPSYFVAPTK